MKKEATNITRFIYIILLFISIPAILISSTFNLLIIFIITLSFIFDFLLFNLRIKNKKISFSSENANGVYLTIIYFIIYSIMRCKFFIKRRTKSKLYKEIENWIEEKKVLVK